MGIRNAPVGRFLVRSHRRFSVRYPVTYKKDGSMEGHGTVVNISAGGWKIEGRMALEPGTRIQLEMLCAPHEAPIRIECATVQWVGVRDFGIRVEQIDPDVLMRWKQRIQKLASTQ